MSGRRPAALEAILHRLATEEGMKSTARFAGHPIHPMLIPYPFAFLSGATAFEIAARARGSDELARTATHLRTAGIVSALVAAVPGIVDYLTTVPEGRPKRTATVHMLSNVSALACFTAAALRDRGRREGGAMPFDLAGTVLLGIGGWLGGTLSYHHQVGVDPEEAPRGRTIATPASEPLLEPHSA